MKIPAISPIERAFLAPAAMLERDTRERHFPALVKAGKITREEATGELAAWRTLAELLESGETQRQTSWSELHLYMFRCLQALERDVKKAETGDADKLRKLIERRDLVAAIHARIDQQKHLIDDATTLLRQQAEAARMVA